MAVIGKLTALKVAREKRPGLYGDGGGLYLQITARGSKSWIFRFWIAERDPKTGELVRDPTTKQVKGRSREMGLGSCITVSLAEARDRAMGGRKLREQAIDPIEAREGAKRQAALERAKSLKFREAAATYMATHRVAWKNDKHAAQWTATLQTYAYPLFGDVLVQAIDTALIMKVIEPIWCRCAKLAHAQSPIICNMNPMNRKTAGNTNGTVTGQIVVPVDNTSNEPASAVYINSYPTVLSVTVCRPGRVRKHRDQ